MRWRYTWTDIKKIGKSFLLSLTTCSLLFASDQLAPWLSDGGSIGVMAAGFLMVVVNAINKLIKK